MAWCAAHKRRESRMETPILRARSIKKLSVEFESVNKARIKRNRLKLLSNPRSESFGTLVFAGVGSCDSRIKNNATSTAATAGIAARRKTEVNSLAVGA